jgi:hypothetical protein
MEWVIGIIVVVVMGVHLVLSIDNRIRQFQGKRTWYGKDLDR